MIQSINTFIDTFQGAKTSFVKTFVTNEELAKPLNTYIYAQTTFAKKVAEAAASFYTSIGLSLYSFDASKALKPNK